MPIYEFLCDNCGAEKELLLKNFEEAENTFPQCECQVAMRRVISAVRTKFGKGWWSKDYTTRVKDTDKEKNRKSV